MKKVGIYVRLSQEDMDKNNVEEDSRSIKNQKTMLLNYCIAQDFEVYEIYCDDDYTGSDRSRPAFQRLIKDAQDGKFEIVLCKSQSRFTREMELVEKYIHTLFPIWGIRFIGLVDNADTENAGNKKARQINGLVNEWYLEDMSNSIRSVFATKRSNGKHIGSFACYGYIKDQENKGGLLIDEEAAVIVREIFDLYEQGYGQVKICQVLNDKNIPNPATYKRLKGMNFKVGNGIKNHWVTTTIRDILSNEMYIGNMVQHKKENISFKSKKQKKLDKSEWVVIENTHQPIIEKEKFIRVQEAFKNKRRSYKNGIMNKYAKKIKCMYCGSGMSTNTWRNERYYRCRQKVVDKNNCQGSLIKSSVLDEAVAKEFKKIASEFLAKNEVEQNIIIINDRAEQLQNFKKIISIYQNQLEKTKVAIKNLYMDKINEIITENDYLEFFKSFNEDRGRLEENITEYELKYQKLSDAKAKDISKKYLLEYYLDNLEITANFIDSLIEKIEIGKKEDDQEETPIIIHWKF